MYSDTILQIVKCLEDQVQSSINATPSADVIILDGAFVVQTLKPGISETFEDYANNIFIPNILSWFQRASRMGYVQAGHPEKLHMCGK